MIEPAVAFLHEHSVQRAHTDDTRRTYAEILYDWFETLEQNDIPWESADAVDLVAYRNRMMAQPSPHTGRPYRTTTINHRVRGVLRFYEWAVRTQWLNASPLADKTRDLRLARHQRPTQASHAATHEHSIFILRQYEALPRPLVSEQARELLAELAPPYDLMARWQLYTGLRISELLRLSVNDIGHRRASATLHHAIEVIRKGRKPGHVIAPASLLDETDGYVSGHRFAWLARARRKGRISEHKALFVNARGSPAGKNAYQRAVSQAGLACGFKATTHLLRATFACMLLARLEHLADRGAKINPLIVVKVLLGHEHLDTTDRYLRAVAVDPCVLKDVLDTLLSEAGAP
ncbi:tyrosine-type recombinase/integrase [Piscinibacter koreensis]|uniref:tyrosine-type recombinase/integrase n=1 Tax=Piscinibacter koreensis TaxID=2742824 RepID=UPI001591A3D3|nr:tyrosine-type recombinase/integrase [Schlegelella koreensis]